MKKLVLVLSACAAAPALPAARFANAPPATVVDDRRDVPDRPHEDEYLFMLYHYDGIFQRRLTRALELPRPRRALGVNALDEVPDSTWFTNRIGVHEMSPEEVARGPETIESPELHLPWTIQSSKFGGSELGYIIKDARGEKYMIKFDPRGMPEQETATHLIVNRVLWACGYNVPEDFVVYFRRADLRIAPGAYVKLDTGRRALDAAELDRELAMIETDADGRVRAMASRWLVGKPLGGPPSEGVREDDPNDRIPHELRRDLRGAFAIFAWLDHEDIQRSNFLDMWVADRADPTRHYVKHYALDFGKSMGVMATTSGDPRSGHEYVVDLADMTRSLVTAGTFVRPWEDRTAPPLRGVGLFEAESYDPGHWRQSSPAYVPFLTTDRIDNFWGAKILMRFTHDQLRAIVDAARYTDPRAAAYVLDTLVARQRATARYWFGKTNPLDRFAVTDDRLCFDDLMLAYGLDAQPTRYRATAYDRTARPFGGVQDAAPDGAGHACVALALAPANDGYTIVKVQTERAGFVGATYVHLARAPQTGEARIIGIWRE